jgi:hypothetical protein
LVGAEAAHCRAAGREIIPPPDKSRRRGGHVPDTALVPEAEWLAATDPTAMLEFLVAKASARKLWLFAYGCARSHWQALRDPHGRKLLGLADHYVDGQTTVATAIREIHRIGYATGISWTLRSEAAEGALR